MSSEDDSVLVRGEPVDPAEMVGDIEVEANGYATLGRGLFYFGIAVFASGPLRALQALPSDLTTATAATFEPAVANMMLGVAFVALAGMITVASSGPVSRSLSRIVNRGGETDSPDPLADGGDRRE